ncbi:MAG: hypothetical protein RLN82_03980, partial [Pseudomonadales bacterium]
LSPQMSPKVFDAVMSEVPQLEADIPKGEHYMMAFAFETSPHSPKVTYQPLNPSTAKDKLILFCHAFKQYRQVPYYPKEHEKANIKNVMVNKELLDVFFTSPLQHFTIDNYISRYNITRDQAKNGKPVKDSFKFPGHYDAAFEKTLSGASLQAYWKHLRANGWEKVTLANQQKVWKETGRKS